MIHLRGQASGFRLVYQVPFAEVEFLVPLSLAVHHHAQRTHWVIDVITDFEGAMWSVPISGRAVVYSLLTMERRGPSIREPRLTAIRCDLGHVAAAMIGNLVSHVHCERGTVNLETFRDETTIQVVESPSGAGFVNLEIVDEAPEEPPVSPLPTLSEAFIQAERSGYRNGHVTVAPTGMTPVTVKRSRFAFFEGIRQQGLELAGAWKWGPTAVTLRL